MMISPSNMTAGLLCLYVVCFSAGCEREESKLLKTLGQTNEEAFLKQRAEEKQKDIKLLNAAYREPLGKFRASGWDDVFLPLHVSGVCTSGPCKVEACHAKKAEYYLPNDELMVFNVNVIAFVTPRVQVWAGPEQQFYIETDSGVVGGRFEFGNILWCDSLIKNRWRGEITLETLLECWKHEVSSSDIAEANRYSTTREWEFIRKRITKVCDVFFDVDFYIVQPTGQGEEFFGIEVEGNLVRLDFRRSRDPVSGIGSAWIDIKSRKLQKVAVNGKQVWPK